MATETAAAEKFSGPATVEPLMHENGEVNRKHAKAGIAMAAATFVMAAASGIQAALYLHSFGIDGRTDGFFVAFALYTVFGVFSQSIRVTSAPLLVDKERALPVREFAATLALIAVPVALLTMPLAHPLSLLLAPGLNDGDRAVTQDALPILGGAMILQLWAAGGATVLAMRDRFNTVASAYIGGAGAGLVAYVGVSGSAGELSLGYSMLAMGAVTFGLMLIGLRGSDAAGEPTARPLRLRRLVTDAGLILGRTSIYLTFNALYLVTLAFTSKFQSGDATVLSYAYLYASYLVAGTAFALGMSRIADMSRGVLADWRAVLADTVPHGFRYSMLIVAPALAGLVAAGAPLMGELFSASLTAGDVDTLRSFGALLGLWTVGALLVNLLLPAMFALGRARLVNMLAPALLGLHVVATAIGGELFGSEGVVGAAFIAPLSFAGVLLVTGARQVSGHLARELTRDCLRFAVPAAACFAAGAAIGAAVADGVTGSLIAGATGTLFYLALLPLIAAQQVALVIRSLRPNERKPATAGSASASASA
jgi:peptidoglycan biosynthesis protein MviN/MurJ (putative lipid II flippase)